MHYWNMKTNRKSLLSQRAVIENKLRPWTTLRADKVPRSGWIKAVRGSLGMTSRQLAERLGIQQSGVTRLEEREANGKVTLEMINRAAKAMNCKLIYAVVPDDRFNDLETIIDDHAHAVARELVERTEHSMKLENQGTDAVGVSTQIDKLADALKSKQDPRIWQKGTQHVDHRKGK